MTLDSGHWTDLARDQILTILEDLWVFGARNPKCPSLLLRIQKTSCNLFSIRLGRYIIMAASSAKFCEMSHPCFIVQAEKSTKLPPKWTQDIVLRDWFAPLHSAVIYWNYQMSWRQILPIVWKYVLCSTYVTALWKNPAISLAKRTKFCGLKCVKKRVL